MTAYAGRRIFRASRWLLALLGAAECLFLTGALVLYRSEGLSLRTFFLAGAAVAGVLAMVDGVTRRVVLTSDALRVDGLWSRRSYAKRDIVSVTEEKGGPAALKLAGGGWAKLPPDLGRGIGNSVRAWLKADT